jgi:competence protein ComEA
MNRMTMVVLLAWTLGVSSAAAQEGARQTSAVGSTAAAVNLNTASVAQLETLPGIGRATAERIVEYRQKNGGFRKAEELMNVRGVGEKSFLKLKPLVTVTMPRAERAGQDR